MTLEANKKYRSRLLGQFGTRPVYAPTNCPDPGSNHDFCCRGVVIPVDGLYGHIVVLETVDLCDCGQWCAMVYDPVGGTWAPNDATWTGNCADCTGCADPVDLRCAPGGGGTPPAWGIGNCGYDGSLFWMFGFTNNAIFNFCYDTVKFHPPPNRVLIATTLPGRLEVDRGGSAAALNAHFFDSGAGPLDGTTVVFAWNSVKLLWKGTDVLGSDYYLVKTTHTSSGMLLIGIQASTTFDGHEAEPTVAGDVITFVVATLTIVIDLTGA